MRSASRLVLALAAALALVAATAARAAQPPDALVALRRAVPLDAAPGATGRPIAIAYADQVVRVAARAGDWTLVERADGVRGWGELGAPSPLTCLPRALGTLQAGRLRCGVPLAAATDTWTTWDYPLARAPNRRWRRFGTLELIGLVERVAAAFHRAHPGRRLLVGDLSRPRGGPFGPEFGGPGHASHRKGVDVDVFYPRRDGRQRPATAPAQVDLALVRELAGRFAAAPETRLVFVGCRRRYAVAARGIERLCNGEHENHMHVRIATPG